MKLVYKEETGSETGTAERIGSNARTQVATHGGIKTGIKTKTIPNRKTYTTRMLAAFLAFLMAFGVLPVMQARADDADKWKIMEVRDAATGEELSRMVISGAKLLVASPMDPNIQDFIVNISMQYTQKFDLKLYAVNEDSGFDFDTGFAPHESGVLAPAVSNSYQRYFSNISVDNVVIGAEDDDSADPGDGVLDGFSANVTKYNDRYDYNPQTATAVEKNDDPRGEFLGYLMIGGIPAKDIVLRGYDGDMYVGDCIIVGGTEHSYSHIDASTSDEDRTELTAALANPEAAPYIITEQAGDSLLINRLFWDGTVYKDAGYVPSTDPAIAIANVIPDNIILPPPQTVVTETDTQKGQADGKYVIVAEPKGVDVLRITTKSEEVGTDENDDPIYEDIERVYPGGFETEGLDLTTVTPHRADWAKHYVSLTGLYIDYYDSYKSFGFDDGNFLQHLQDVGDPIDIITGNFHWQYTDLEIHAAEPLSFTRYYNAQLDYNGAMGYGWRHSFDYAVKDNGYTATVFMNDARVLTFVADYITPGLYRSTTDMAYQLVKTSANSYIMVKNDGTEYHFTDGKITEITKQGVNKLTFAYSDDNLTEVSSKAGSLTLSYTGGKITSVKDSSGRSVSYSYDGDRLTGFENADGDKLSFQYNDPYDENNLTEIIDFNGEIYLSNTYDASDRVVSQTMIGQGVTLFAYDRENRVNSFTDASGNTTRYHYNTNRKLTKVEDAQSALHSTFKDGKPISQTDREGNTTTYAYDEAGRPVKTTYPDGSEISTVYNAQGLPSVVTEKDGTTVQYEYDLRGNVTKVTDARGHSIRYEYDAFDNCIKVTDRAGAVTTYTYDAMGNPTEIRSIAAGAAGEDLVTRNTYDVLGRLTSLTTPEGLVTAYEYSAAGKLLRTIDPDESHTAYEVTPNGYTTAVTDPLGNIIRVAYNGMNQVTAFTDAEGNQTVYEYDANGRLTRITDPAGHSTAYTYDERNNIASITDARGNSTTFAYDGESRNTAYTDPYGHTTAYTFDSMGNVSAVQNARGAVASGKYDPMGRITESTDALGNVTSFAYDANGNLVKLTDPMGYETKYAYDGENRLQRIIDALGFVTEFERDALGRVVKITNALNRESVTEYNGDGAVLSQTDALGRVSSFTYDDYFCQAKNPSPNKIAYWYCQEKQEDFFVVRTKKYSALLTIRKY